MAETIATTAAALTGITNRMVPAQHPAGNAAEDLRVLALRTAALLGELLKRCPS